MGVVRLTSLRVTRDLSMLAIPVRRTEHSNTGQALAQCIETEYHQNAEKYKDDIELVDNARSRAVKAIEESGYNSLSLKPIQAYIDVLWHIQRKFPSSIETDFVWYSSLGYASNAAVSYASLQFDMANMQYNIAAIYSQMGQSAISTANNGIGIEVDANSIKVAYNYFQLAAGALKSLSQITLPLFRESIAYQQLPVGLDEDTVSALLALMLAQAQECFWQRATIDATSGSLNALKDQSIAKLAAQVSEYYSSSHGFMVKALGAFKAEWIAHVECKRLHFLAAAHYRMAQHALNKSKYGLEIAHLQRAFKLASEAGSTKHLPHDTGTQLISDATGLSSKTRSELTRAERDNDLIYYEAVPQAGAIGCTNMANANSESSLDRTARLELFDSLLPYRVYQVSSAFKEKLTEFVHANVIRPAQALSAQLDKSLMDLSLPGSLDALEKPLGVPDRLLEFAQELQTVHGVEQLRLSLRDIEAMGNESSRLLEEASESLMIDEKEDTFMRSKYGTDRWTREPSRVAAQDLWNIRDELDQYLNMGRKGDGSIRSSFSCVEERLMTLESGQAMLEQRIPQAVAVKWGADLEKAIADLRQALQRARGMDRQRTEHLRDLEHQTSQLNLLPDVTKEYYRQEQSMQKDGTQQDRRSNGDSTDAFDSIYSEELAKLDTELEWIHNEDAQQRRLIDLITERNDRFATMSRADPSMLQRQDVVQQYEQAFYKLKEMQRNLKEAHHFYNSIRARLQDLCNQARTFVYNRRVEAQSLHENTL